MRTLPLILFTLTALSAGCTTQFFGGPMFPGGAPGCMAHCQMQSMDMTGFVYAGEYSTACICSPRPVAPAPPRTAEATTAASVAVVTMMRAQQQQSAAAAQRH